jgi:hypothetical protein
VAVFETFAKRRRQLERAGAPDVFTYDSVPKFLRHQVSMIADAAPGPCGNDRFSNGTEIWRAMCEILEKEIETFPSPGRYDNSKARCQHFIATEPDTENWLSLIEIICRVFESRAKKGHPAESIGATQEAKDALEEINTRFREHSFGYQFEETSFGLTSSSFMPRWSSRP